MCSKEHYPPRYNPSHSGIYRHILLFSYQIEVLWAYVFLFVKYFFFILLGQAIDIVGWIVYVDTKKGGNRC